MGSNLSGRSFQDLTKNAAWQKFKDLVNNADNFSVAISYSNLTTTEWEDNARNHQNDRKSHHKAQTQNGKKNGKYT